MWSQYCVDTFVYWSFSHYYLLAIHFSHLYRSMRDIQMLAHKTLQRPECFLVPWEMLYIHTGRVHYNLFRKRYIPEGPTDVVHQGFTLCQGKIFLFPFCLKLITKIIIYQIFVVYTKFIYICIYCYQICLLSPKTSANDFSQWMIGNKSLSKVKHLRHVHFGQTPFVVSKCFETIHNSVTTKKPLSTFVKEFQ